MGADRTTPAPCGGQRGTRRPRACAYRTCRQNPVPRRSLCVRDPARPPRAAAPPDARAAASGGRRVRARPGRHAARRPAVCGAGLRGLPTRRRPRRAARLAVAAALRRRTSCTRTVRTRAIPRPCAASPYPRRRQRPSPPHERCPCRRPSRETAVRSARNRRRIVRMSGWCRTRDTRKRDPTRTSLFISCVGWVWVVCVAFGWIG